MNSKVLLTIINFANDIIFDENEDDEEITIIPKISNFVEEIVPQFSTNQFQQHFQLLPNTFDKILGYLIQIPLEQKHLDGHPEITLEKQLLITIWYLPNLESFRSVANRFNVSKSTCWDVLRRTSLRLLEVNRLYGIIRWPTEEQALQTMQTFERRSQIPGIIGCIDGSHVTILAPKRFPNSYINRKRYHSILIQGVCNEQKLFIDIYTGEPGSLHDSNLFSKSDLAQRIENGSITFYNDSHLIGDLAYKLSRRLIVGFKNLDNMTQREINFNKRLNSCRVEIENAFALLKERYRRLKYIETVRLDLISLFIVTAAVLHNACILNDDLPIGLINVNEEVEEERRNNINVFNNDVANNARQKRLNILYNLPVENE